MDDSKGSHQYSTPYSYSAAKTTFFRHLYRFNLASALGATKSMTGADLLISLWVYMDDLNTEQNVIYVSISPLLNIRFLFKTFRDTRADALNFIMYNFNGRLVGM